jgi:hypothetical protein
VEYLDEPLYIQECVCLWLWLVCSPDNSELSALTSALTAMTAAVATDWVTQLDDLMQALTEGVGPANPFSSRWTQVIVFHSCCWSALYAQCLDIYAL